MILKLLSLTDRSMFSWIRVKPTFTSTWTPTIGWLAHHWMGSPDIVLGQYCNILRLSPPALPSSATVWTGHRHRNPYLRPALGCPGTACTIEPSDMTTFVAPPPRVLPRDVVPPTVATCCCAVAPLPPLPCCCTRLLSPTVTATGASNRFTTLVR